MRILLVDDEIRFISALSKRLLLRGIDADWVCTGEEAIDRVKNARYDLAVLDVKMPGIGGIELKRTLHEINPDMKFIFITGHGSMEDFTVGSTEASSYLVKPLRFEEFLEKINAALKKKNDRDS